MMRTRCLVARQRGLGRLRKNSVFAAASAPPLCRAGTAQP